MSCRSGSCPTRLALMDRRRACHSAVRTIQLHHLSRMLINRKEASRCRAGRLLPGYRYKGMGSHAVNRKDACSLSRPRDPESSSPLACAPKRRAPVRPPSLPLRMFNSRQPCAVVGGGAFLADARVSRQSPRPGCQTPQWRDTAPAWPSQQSELPRDCP